VARAAKINHVKAPGPLTSALLPPLMRLLTKTALKPERALGPEQRYRIDWDTPVQSERDALRVGQTIPAPPPKRPGRPHPPSVSTATTRPVRGRPSVDMRISVPRCPQRKFAFLTLHSHDSRMVSRTRSERDPVNLKFGSSALTPNG
jgi:hypothetical protein